MGVILIVPSYATGGEIAIPAIRTLVAELARHIHLEVIALRYPPQRATWWDGPARIHSLGGEALRTRDLLKAAWQLIREIDRERPVDVLHAIWLSEPGLVAVLAGRLMRKPAIVSIGGAEVAYLPEIGYGGLLDRRARLIHRSILRSASLVTGGSDYVLGLARDLTPGLGPHKLARVPLPVDLDRFPFDPRIGRREIIAPRLLQVGAYLPVKGQRMSIEALAMLSSRWPDAHLTMIGEDPIGLRSELLDLTRQLGIEGRVDLLDRVPHQNLLAHYQAADLFVFPSLHESQGIAALEAAAVGVPVVGSNVGVVRDLAPTGAVGLPPGDARLLAQELERVLRDRGRRAAMAAAARRWVEYFASPESAAERFIDCYRRVVRR